jgi:hypothetical protein
MNRKPVISDNLTRTLIKWGLWLALAWLAALVLIPQIAKAQTVDPIAVTVVQSAGADCDGSYWLDQRQFVLNTVRLYTPCVDGVRVVDSAKWLADHGEFATTLTDFYTNNLRKTTILRLDFADYIKDINGRIRICGQGSLQRHRGWTLERNDLPDCGNQEADRDRASALGIRRE